MSSTSHSHCCHEAKCLMENWTKNCYEIQYVFNINCTISEKYNLLRSKYLNLALKITGYFLGRRFQGRDISSRESTK